MLLLIAFLWGFAEATLFFLVPDIFFTYLVLFNLKIAFLSSLCSLLGALIGGALMYQWGKKNYCQATHIVQMLPGISHRLIQREQTLLKKRRGWAILFGPLKGVPYKIFAICAAACRLSLTQFLLISIPARLLRFIVSILITELLFHWILSPLSLLSQMIILSLFWLIFYTLYFLQMKKYS